MAIKKILIYGMLILSMLFWAMTYIWYKFVFQELNPISVMLIRLSFSAIFMFLFSLFIKKLRFISKSDFVWFLLLAFFQPFIYFLAEAHGVNLVSSTISAVIISTIPVFTPLATYIFYKEKVSKYNILGIFISFFGVLAVVLGKDLNFSGSVFGIFLLCGAVFAALGYAVIIVKLTNKYNPFTIISWQNLLGALFFFPIFLIFDRKYFVQANFTPSLIKNLIYLSLFGSSLAYLFFTYAIKYLGVIKASMFTNIIPIFTAILAFYVLHDTIDLVKWLGIFIVLCGLYLSQINKKKNKGLLKT